MLLWGCARDRTAVDMEDLPVLRSGMLVFRLGNGVFSNEFRQRASHEQRFSHVGIVCVEQGRVTVYHTEASEWTGRGGAKKEDLKDFLMGARDVAFYELPVDTIVLGRFLKKAQEYYEQRVPFDLDFDNSTDDRLYCTELVSKALNSAFDSIVVRASLDVNGKKIFALDDLYGLEGIIKYELRESNKAVK